jgi:AraC family transcriptional regulator
MAEIQTLFASSLVTVESYQNVGAPTAGAEESTAAHEIVLPRRGAFVRYDTTGKTLADSNCVMFFRRDQPYQISYPIPGGEESTIFRLAPAVLQDILRMFDVSAADRHNPFAASHWFIDAKVRLRQYQLLNDNSDLASEEQILAFLGDILRQAAHYKGRPQPRKRTVTQHAHREIAHQIKIVLAQRYSEKLRLSDIAAAVNSSPFFVCRLFKMETGMSIHQYVQRLRLMSALDHLAQYPQADLTELALDLGFASHSHFSTAFLRAFAVSPSGFRETMYAETSKILKV